MEHSGISVLFQGRNFVRLLGGLWTSVWIAALALVFGLLLGALIGLLRTSKSKLLRAIFRIYLEFFRIVPTVVLLFLFYYILPRQVGINWPGSVMATIAFALWVSAEFSDIVRGALISVPKVQQESGLALGLSKWQLFIYVLLPQAFQLELPATINLATRVIKTTSLLMMISVMELASRLSRLITSRTQPRSSGFTA
jgi:polar amino acid transport system permease protein